MGGGGGAFRCWREVEGWIMGMWIEVPFFFLWGGGGKGRRGSVWMCEGDEGWCEEGISHSLIENHQTGI